MRALQPLQSPTNKFNRYFVNLIALLFAGFLSFSAYSEDNLNQTEGEESITISSEESLNIDSETPTTDEIPLTTLTPIQEKQRKKKKSGSFYEDFKHQQEETLEKTLKAADQSQENVSKRLHRFSTYVDTFFAEDNYVQENDDSRMRVSLANRYQKYEDPTFQPRVNLSLALPNTQNRWRIRFQSNDELENKDSNVDSSLADSVSETTYSTALGLMLLATDLLDIRADVGIKFNTPIDPFTRLRVRRSFLLEKTEFHITEIFQWRDSEGRTANTALDIEYPFNLTYFLRSHSEGIYWDIDSYWTSAQSFTLYQRLNQKSILAYAIGIHAQNEDDFHLRKKDQVNDYWVELRYRKNFYKDWLFYQVSPGLIRPREYDFETLPRLELKLEALYGNLTK